MRNLLRGARIGGAAGLALTVLLSGCSRVRMETPEGFAPLETRKVFRAVSPEGVLFRVRRLKNEPRMDLEFWSETLRIHLEREGYRGGRASEVDIGETDGALFEWVVPYGGDTWAYLTAVVPAGRHLYVAEAAGEHNLMRGYRPAILASLESLQP